MDSETKELVLEHPITLGLFPERKEDRDTLKELEKEVNGFKVGDILYASWGYDMTINDYCKIVEISPTRKTVKCKMVKCVVKDDNGLGKGRSKPTGEEKGNAFRLFVREYNGCNGDKNLFVGQYPFCEGATRRGSFWLWEGGEDYYNTWD